MTTPRFHIPHEMSVIEIVHPGGPEVLVPTTRPVPRAGADEVLIRVDAAGVNGPDVLQRKGLYKPPPGASDIPGLEVSGGIVEVGSDVRRFKAGDRVCALLTGGGYAEYAVANQAVTMHVPAGLDMIEAAAMPETFMTVWLNLVQRGNYRPASPYSSMEARPALARPQP
ncbi:zinc-containing alcohol dehydrogenase superfamily protein [Caballeronia catudaia]|uniref:Zinc-containing alcohol dehydrogenase superfamily protein n=1 Tax=Caballeronia catudaia TaxID=1777136 RepID=A0A158DHW0_9BURK|nr:zinc-containing alcohol dehydrogenase superfamily protein [Caballeronia catudaia]